MNKQEEEFLKLWNDYKKGNFPKNFEILIEISKRNQNDYVKEKENVLNEIKSNLNIIKVKQSVNLVRKKFIKEGKIY
jgi:hypothetical protein